jgi:SAM-dependent methyltransferase
MVGGVATWVPKCNASSRADFMPFPTTLQAAMAAMNRVTAVATSHNSEFPMSASAVPLPPNEFMIRVGSPDAANFLYVCDQWSQVASRLLKPSARILDIGAGCGKPARAFLHHPYVVEYVGLDVDTDLVNWANAYLRPASSKRFLFTWLNVQSDTYARSGTVPAEMATFPVAPDHFSFVIAASLFTHLTTPATANYLRQARVASVAGAQLLASIHIELDGDAGGNTERADYRRSFFVELASTAGWTLAAPLGELAGQEALLFTAI